MNLKKVQFVCEIMTEQFNHWALFPFALLFMGATIANTGIFTPNVWVWMIAAIFPLALFFIRSRFDQILPFMLLHIAVIVVSFLIPTGNLYRYIYVFAAVYYVINSLLLRYKRNSVYSSMIAAPAILGFYFFASVFQSESMRGRWDSYFYVSQIYVIALFFVIFYIKRYIDFLTVNKSSAGYLPARDMFHSGLSLVLWFTGGCVLIFFLSLFTNVFGDLWNVISAWLMKVLRYLFSLLPESDKSNQPIEKDDYGISGGILGLGRNETFWLWDLLQFVFLIALFITVIYILIKLIIKLIEFIQGRFRATRKTEVEQEESIDVREKIEIEKRPAKKITNPFDRFSPRERIRRMYKKKVLASTVGMSSLDTDKLDIYTAMEWERKLQTQGMAAIYEQARYSAKDMSMDDVRKMKDACKSVEE